jgi:transposase-like protein
MKDVYSVAGITKQAHFKECRSHALLNHRIQELVINVDILRKAHPGCGLEKMYRTLKPDFIGRDKFIEIMMSLGYRVKQNKNYKRTTYAGLINFPNLITGMLLWSKNQLWQSDITYIEAGGRFYYLVMIIDVYTKEIIGYALSNHMRASANIAALEMAIAANPGSLKDLIHHSDKGSQYTSHPYLQILNDHGITPSMGIKGQDNAYAEKLNSTIKNEYIKYRNATTEKELKAAVRQAIKNYNQSRIHNSLPSNKTPKSFANCLISLDYPQRPKVIVYTDGKQKVKDVSNNLDFLPHKDQKAPVCPIIYN